MSSSLFIAISCLSYITTGKHDLRLIVDAEELGTTESFTNVMGKSGAHTAYFFMNQLFGIAALFIPFYFFILGVKVFSKKTLLPLARTARLSLFGMLLIPVIVGFLFHKAVPGTEHAVELTCNENLVGAYGYHMTVWSSYTLGWIGTFLVLLFLTSAVVIFNLSGPLAYLQSKMQAIWVSKDAEDEEETEEDTGHPSNQLKSLAEEEGEEEEPDPAQDALDDLIEEDSVPFELESEITVDEEVAEEIEAEETEEPEERMELETTVPEPEAQVEDESPSDLDIAETTEEKELSEDELDTLVQKFGEYDPKLDLSHYELPSIESLNQYSSGTPSIDKNELEANKNKIVETLSNYKIEISKIMATIGPTVTLYEIVSSSGCKDQQDQESGR